MTIDEAIEFEYEQSKKIFENSSEYCKKIANDLIEESKYHEDIAEWLEELKTLRAEVAEMHDERQAEGAFMMEHDEQIKADAIEEFYNRLLAHKKDINVANNPWNYIELTAREMAEQLKEK